MSGTQQAAARFRPDLQVFPQREEGARARVVLKDPVSEKFYHVSEYEYHFLKSLNGRVSLEEAVEDLKEGGRYYSPDTARKIVDNADRLGLLVGTRHGSPDRQRYLRSRLRAAQRLRWFSGVYFWFIPLVNPDRFLERTVWLFKLVVNRWTGLLAVCAAPPAIFLVISDLPRIRTEYLFFFNWHNLLYLWVTIAITKLVHEFSHAYVAKSFGLRVPRMGIAILIFFPCLYCDTTDAWRLAGRKQRILIAAAGIMAEAVVAISAAYVWYFTNPGIVNSLAFYLMAVSLVSTVIFNGNPLLRFDGYFILMDYLRIPNLATKSATYLKHLFMNGVLGLPTYRDPASTPRERYVFMQYGISAFAYRIFLYTAIVMGVYYRFDKVVGVALALMAFFLFIVRPMAMGVGTLYAQRGAIDLRPRGLLIFLIIVVVVVGVLCVPLAGRSVFPAFLASTQVQKLTVPLHTMVKKVNIREGSFVKKRDVLFELDTSDLELILEQREDRKKILSGEVELLMLDPAQMAKAPSKVTLIKQVEREIELIKRDLEIARAGIIAPFDGFVTKLDYRLQPGFKPREGTIVGELQSPTDCVVIALVTAEDTRRLRPGMEAEVWFPLGEGMVFRKEIESIKAYSERDLSDSPFSSRFGGELATEVFSEVRKDVPLEAQFYCSVKFDNGKAGVPLGMTGRVSVPALPQSLAARLYHRMVRTFRKEAFL